jgi:regulator of protease activity HflC (stomatin/prohibitin superfamily)
MGRYYDKETDTVRADHLVLDGTAITLLVIGSLMAGCPVYNVWQQGLAGKAALSRAEQDRQIAIQEAMAKHESAKFLAEAEVARAQGVAQANKIIGDSLKGNEAYLRYLWVTDVAANPQGRTVVYIPTEANMPLMEAGKRPSGEAK